MSSAAQVIYTDLLKEIDRKLPGGKFDAEQIRTAVETASRADGAIPIESRRAAKKKSAYSRSTKKQRSHRLSHGGPTRPAPEKH